MPRQGQGVWINNPEDLPGGEFAAGGATAANQETQTTALQAIRDRLPAAGAATEATLALVRDLLNGVLDVGGAVAHGGAVAGAGNPVLLGAFASSAQHPPPPVDEEGAQISRLWADPYGRLYITGDNNAPLASRGYPITYRGGVLASTTAYAQGDILGGGGLGYTVVERPAGDEPILGVAYVLQRLDYLSPLAGLSLSALIWSGVPAELADDNQALAITAADRPYAALEVPLAEVSTRGGTTRYSADLGAYCLRVSGGLASPGEILVTLVCDEAPGGTFATTDGGVIIVSGLLEG